MPIIKSAIKRLRQITRRTERNRKQKGELKKLTHDFKADGSVQLFNTVVSKLDKAVKKHLIHKNKAARLKSRLSKKIKK